MTPTVYSTIARDGTIRMALHPTDRAPQYSTSEKPRITWPFRVVYTKKTWGRLAPSCRGIDAHDDWFGWEGDGDALAWLLEGEVQP